MAGQQQLQPDVLVKERYRLVRPLAAGGMGSVWLARDTSLDVDCAMKFIDDAMLSSNEVRARFPREAKVAAQIRSPHVVDVFEYGVWDERPYIAMEYMEGEDLAQRLARYGLLDAESTYRIVAHVARALSRAHARGIVHRDLKPENVFLVDGDAGEVAKVLDFGIAQHNVYSLKDKATKTGSCVGTPFYMSPEQARAGTVDHRSDLWSLAVITFQCLSGRPPFSSSSLGALFGQIMYDPIPDPSVVAPHLPESLNEWWRKATERDPDARFQSAAELSDSLAVALGLQRIAVGGTQVGGSTPSVISLPPPRLSDLCVTPALRTSDAPLSRTNATAQQAPLRRRAKKAWLGIAAAAALGLAAAGLGLSGRLTAPAAGTPPPQLAVDVASADTITVTPVQGAEVPSVASPETVADVAAEELFREPPPEEGAPQTEPAQPPASSAATTKRGGRTRAATKKRKPRRAKPPKRAGRPASSAGQDVIDYGI
jgi:serine/threonine-protein kinase